MTRPRYIVPNFSALNIISSVAHAQPVPTQLIVYNTIYALLYASMALCGAVLIFQRRNLK
jgi:hypothetical protein